MLHIHKIVLVVCLNLFLVYAADVTTAATAAADQVAINNINIPTCKEYDANINDCLLKILQDMIPRSKNGIPELNVPSMDPLAVNRTTLVFSHPLFEGKLSLRNVKIHGLSDMKIKKVQYRREGDRAYLKDEGYLANLFIEGEYRAKMRFNAANLSSRGPFNVTFTNVNVTHQGYAEYYKKDDGHVYMRVKTFNFNPTVDNMLFQAEGLMPDPLLNDAILEFLNENWRPIYKNIIPETRAAWEPEIIKVANLYLSHVPLDAVLKE